MSGVTPKQDIPPYCFSLFVDPLLYYTTKKKMMENIIPVQIKREQLERGENRYTHLMRRNNTPKNDDGGEVFSFTLKFI